LAAEARAAELPQATWQRLRLAHTLGSEVLNGLTGGDMVEKRRAMMDALGRFSAG